MTMRFIAMDSDRAKYFRDDGADAYGKPPQRVTSDGNGNPCRHCMTDIVAGRQMLVLAHRPFQELHPYAETGPILLCADECDAFGMSSDLPSAIASRSEFILRGYSSDEVIVEGTGKVISTKELRAYAERLLARKDVASVHIRSSSNNCYFCKIENA